MRARSELLVVAALTALALVQPVLDLFGSNPASLQFRGVEGGSLVSAALALIVVPPLVLWGTAELVRRIDDRLGAAVHVATVGLLIGLLGVMISKELTEASLVNILIGVLAGVGGIAAYLRLGGVQQWLKLLSAANLLFLAQFLFLAPSSDLLTTDTSSVAAAEFDAGALDERGDPASVVMIVVDELATQSILAEGEEQIDPVRFPNLASFAEDATWYRRHTTVSPFTQSAVPVLLDGRDPTGDPTFDDHPDNLFTHLAGSHELVVSEALTRLCGIDECEGVTDLQWGNLLGDALDVWRARVRPGAADEAENFDDFVEELQTADLGASGDDEQSPPVTTASGASARSTALENLDLFFRTSIGAQPTRHADFVDALQPNDDPFFAFLHVVLPHQPWLSRTDGTQYDVPGNDDTEPDVRSPWRARVTRQRHLLQAEYTDRLVGIILDRLKEVDEYDDAAVVIVSDHGVSFEPNQSTRSITDENIEQIAYSPLLIKGPGQTEGQVDDANVLSVDLAPTVAGLLGTELGWDLDGTDVLEAATGDRGNEKYIYDYTDAFSYELRGIREFDDRRAHAEMLDGRFPSVSADVSRLAGLYEVVPGADLIGRQSSSVYTEGGPAVDVRELDALRDPSKPELLAEVSGRVPDADVPSPDGEDTVVVAVNGTIVGVSPLFENDDGPNQFVVLLPDGALEADENRLEVGLLTANGASVRSSTLSSID